VAEEMLDYDIDAAWHELTRKQKSTLFRMKRRQLHMHLFGNPFKRKGAVKNLHR